jgi:predicted O-linked N-acetylglucosamine transferase (SPINDLY family)
VNAAAAELERALGCIHAGQLQQAEALCLQVLGREAHNFNALQLLGHIALQAANYPAAAERLRAALSIRPGSAAVQSNLAVALLALRRPQEALHCCEAALRLTPRFPEALCNRGHALCALGRHGEGLASYESTLEFAPRFYDAHAGRAKALLSLKRYPQALTSCDSALRINPHSVDAWCLRGSVLLKCKRPEEALAAFDRALSLAPDSPEALNNRGTALRDLKRPAEALETYARALERRPAFAEVWCNAANIALDTGHYAEALARCDRALAIQPDFLEALNIRGTALRLLKRFDEAAAVYQRILAVSPSYGQADSYLLASRANLGDWSERQQQASRIIARVEGGESASAPHAFLWICDAPALQLKCAQLYSDEQFPADAPLWQGEVYRHERLRIAYLSADFTDHPVAHLIAGVLERHDRTRFETFGVSLQRDPAPGPMRERMQKAFEHFEDVSEYGDREVATMLREREVDIAVDLTLHTRGGRLGILACRPAPLSINFLGFAGTAGAHHVDYLIGDAVTVPEGHERFFSERIVRMPHSFLPNDDAQPIAQVSPRRRDVGLPETGFVFCSFNTIYKLNPLMFDIWMRLLRETPGSVLWLRAGDGVVTGNLIAEAQRRGVDAARLVFAPRIQAMDAHLARYRAADLFLDTVPYGAHATARDALWAGLPVLTCAGSSFASRVAASLLTALGMPDLVTATLEEYASRAVTLANSPESMAELRIKLAHQRATRPVFDTDLYRRHLESAYLSLSSRQRRGEAPAALSVPPIR